MAVPTTRAIWPWAPAVGFVVLVQLLAGVQYGLFRDELYYLACAHRLALGYVDHPPLSVWVLRGWTAVVGESDWAVRSLSLVASILSIITVGEITKKLGGDRRAQTLASLTIASMPVLRVVGTLYSPNTWDLVWWSLATLAYLRVRERGSSVDWILLGLALGVATQNRLSGLWLTLALLAAVLISRPKANSITGPFLTSVTMVAVLSPWIGWQWTTGWPTLEFAKNAVQNKLQYVGPFQFVLTQLVVTNPFCAFIWISGLILTIRERENRDLGVALLTVATILILSGHSRENYLSPAYCFIVPIGALRLSERAWAWGPTVAASGFVCCLIALPILPAPTLAKLLTLLPSPPSTERGEKSRLQGLGDTLGWQAQVRAVEEAWKQAPEGTVVIASNYGEAAATERYSRLIPVVICPHNEYWRWGTRGWDGQSAIVIGQLLPAHAKAFERVELIRQLDEPLAVPEEGKAKIWHVQRCRIPVEELWRRLKRFE